MHCRAFFSLVAGLTGFALTVLTSCQTVEPRPEGVGRGISFNVTPLYPHSFEITAGGSRLRDERELREAWQKKAAMIAGKHKFKVTKPPVMHNNESDYGGIYGVPQLTRSVTGTITLLE
ncbi:MAG TPA: hypothetical protein VJ721_02165 [Chthoniobacterales bacterium]|nr:hypothetical protein [Chthoniobacterales bacterium]